MTDINVLDAERLAGLKLLASKEYYVCNDKHYRRTSYHSPIAPYEYMWYVWCDRLNDYVEVEIELAKELEKRYHD